MSRRSNDLGRAYEFACLMVLYEEISCIRPAKIEINSSYYAAEHAWNTLEEAEKIIFKSSALAGVDTILELEPLILDDGDDELELKIQTDSHGESGDVRDVLIIRKGIEWEIGLSIKHNHFAVKHSRLSKTWTLDSNGMGYRVLRHIGIALSQYLIFLKRRNRKALWRNMTSKNEDIYIPLLNAFKNEIEDQNRNPKNRIPRRMVEYLLGQFDFYKVIGIDKQKITKIQSYNLRGTLNKEGKRRKRNIELPIATLPTRIVSFNFKPDSSTTLELYLDGGWQFNFRIHNASSRVEPSLKFDVQIVGMPTTIISIDCKWGNK